MTLGTGLTLLGMWLFCSACALAKEIIGSFLAIVFSITLILTLTFLF